MLTNFSTSPGKLYYSNPTVIALVSVQYSGSINLMPAAWNMPVSRTPPLFSVAMAPSRYSFEIIQEAQEFAVSFVGFELADLLVATGGTSGRFLDKVKALDIKLRAPNVLKTPLILPSYAGYECSLRRTIPLGDHQLLVGEVVGVHWDDRAFSRGLPHWDMMLPALYMGSDTFLAPAPLAEIRLDRHAAAERLKDRATEDLRGVDQIAKLSQLRSKEQTERNDFRNDK